ncbi:hypothetical protein HOY80DRAFT_431124 [Tuber brumale]|nr:hypothetical protein HOY80DRAFT_431124 [Tuber brumale]
MVDQLGVKQYYRISNCLYIILFFYTYFCCCCRPTLIAFFMFINTGVAAPFFPASAGFSTTFPNFTVIGSLLQSTFFYQASLSPKKNDLRHGLNTHPRPTNFV